MIQLAARSSRAPQPTETAVARAHLTDRSRELLPENLLNQRLGYGTVAGGLNDQIRFRLEGTGAVSKRTIAPDSKLAVDLLESPAGPRLMRQLRTAAANADRFSDRTNLKGFVLPEDTQSVMAANLLSYLEKPESAEFRQLAEKGSKRVGPILRNMWRDNVDLVGFAGAWNDSGWITFMPDSARGMLVHAGAYKPKANEPELREASYQTDYAIETPSHEVQHSTTDAPTPDYDRRMWIEEGTASVLTELPVYHDRLARQAGLSTQSYASRLSHKPQFETGWQDWQRPTIKTAETQALADNEGANYVGSQDVLVSLGRMAGADPTTDYGRPRFEELLQSKSVRYVPGKIADAIIEHNSLDPSVRERLRQRIIRANESPEALRKIQSDFGLAR